MTNSMKDIRKDNSGVKPRYINGISFPPDDRRWMWDDGADVAAEMERGGYSANVAGADFPRVVAAVTALRKGDVRGLVIHGKAGSGKTLAASIITRGCFTRGVWELDPDENLYSLRPGTGPVRIDCANLPFMEERDRDNFSLARDRFSSAKVDWWLEDQGAEPPTNMFGIRYDPVALFFQNLKPGPRVVVTTNLDPDGILKRYGERVLSRMMDHFGWVQTKRSDIRPLSVSRF